MAKFHQGVYEVKNKEKYIGQGVPRYRSSWELAFSRFCDMDPRILHWASEPFRIPYQNPLTQKHTVYIPDFLVIYDDKEGNRCADLIEIKPAKQTFHAESKKNRDQLALAVNMAKWDAAKNFAKGKGMVFRVITEQQIFNNT